MEADPGPGEDDEAEGDEDDDVTLGVTGTTWRAAEESRRSEDLRQGPNARGDERIWEEVRDCLSFAHLDARGIEVNVQSGTVRLTGFVKTKRDKQMAQDLVEECRGVNRVENDIDVRLLR